MGLREKRTERIAATQEAPETEKVVTRTARQESIVEEEKKIEEVEIIEENQRTSVAADTNPSEGVSEEVRVCEERSDELRRRVYWILTDMLDTYGTVLLPNSSPFLTSPTPLQLRLASLVAGRRGARAAENWRQGEQLL